MIHARNGRSAKIISILALVIALASVVVGCGSKTASTPSASKTVVAGATAKSGLSAAAAALTTTAPDAKLLVVQTDGAVTVTSAPVWSFLFGSPKSDKTYLVYVTDGKAGAASEYGTAGLSKKEWAVVPNADDWKIDSDAAYRTAQTAAGASTAGAYTMGFLTHVPQSETSSTTKPFTWYVSFDPASGATTGTVEVDANTGAVVAK
jgi:hypothetical protein